VGAFQACAVKICASDCSVKFNRDLGFEFKYLQLTTVGYLRRRRIFLSNVYTHKGAMFSTIQKKPAPNSHQTEE
jgi:hypothetical protein